MNQKNLKIKKTLQGKPAKKVMDFFSAGFSDYIAARVLLNEALLIQGTVLASTALEKYIKGIMAINGNESHGHLKKAHWISLKNYSQELYNRCNIEFLELCQKSYRLRYLDELPDGFNLVIGQIEFLAELDKTVQNFESIVAPQDRTRTYEHTKNSNDKRLFLNNLVLDGPKSLGAAAGFQHVCEIRIVKGNLIEMQYESNKPPARIGFMREALTTLDGQTFSTAFEYFHRQQA